METYSTSLKRHVFLVWKLIVVNFTVRKNLFEFKALYLFSLMVCVRFEGWGVCVCEELVLKTADPPNRAGLSTILISQSR